MNRNATTITRFLSLIAILATAANVDARVLSADEAYQRAIGGKFAKNMMSINSKGSSSSVPELIHTVETDDVPTVYVFSRAGGGAYFVSASDAVNTALLGYTDGGKFDVDSMPDNVAWVLECYGSQIAYASSEEYETTDATLERSDRKNVLPIIEAKWGQTGMFSAYCPEMNGVKCPSGCIATAMAQVMYNYKYPECGTGSISYRSSALKTTFSYDFTANPISWDDITLSNGHVTGDAGADAVGRLMLTCGMSVKMNYNVSGSGASLTSVSRALVKYFNYDKGMALMNRIYYSESEWDEMLYGELSEGRPVLYSGRSTVDGGHAFVIDGYNSAGFYHVNWGWSGNYNGYFVLTALDPMGKNAGFNYDEMMIIGCRPAVEGSTVCPVVEFLGDVTVDKPNAARGVYGEVVIRSSKGIINQSVDASTMTFGVKMQAEDGTISYLASATSKSLVTGQGFTHYVVRHREFPKSGRYRMTPAVKGEDGIWRDQLTKSENEQALYVDCSETALVFTPESEVISLASVKDINVTHLAIKTGYVSSETFDIEAHFNNTSLNHYTKYLTPTLMDENGVVAAGTKLTLELDAYELAESEWACTLSDQIESGNYSMALVDRKGNIIGNPISVQVVKDGTQGLIIQQIDNAEIVSTEVFDINGRGLGCYESIDDAQLNSGIYILRHKMSDGTTKTEKVAL